MTALNQAQPAGRYANTNWQLCQDRSTYLFGAYDRKGAKPAEEEQEEQEEQKPDSDPKE